VTTTEAGTIAELARKSAAAATIKTEDGREFLIAPNESTIKDISDEHALSVTLPRYIKQTVTLQTQDSLVDYVNRYKSPDTVLFADISANAILATLDYHAADKAARVAHRAVLNLPFSEEWRLWTGISGQLKGQLEFARFLEENGADVRAPDAAELLEACRDLQAHRKVNFIKAVRTSSENETFEYQDETKATTKAGIDLPTKFKLGIPVYFGEPDTELFAFLRWAIDTDKGGLSLGIALHRAEHVRQAVFKQIVEGVASRTGCIAVFGKI
jgi:uncharacterized protein YfdQ (DUF2303 family)